MKIAAAHDFHDEVAERAAAICPDIEWALTDRAGTWTVSPEGADAVIYAGDAYTEVFVDAVAAIAPPRWAHTEDAGIDGRFYDDMRAKGVAVTHSPGANAPEVAEFAFAGVMWGAKRLGEFRDQQRAHEWRQLGQTALGSATVLVVGLGAIGKGANRGLALASRKNDHSAAVPAAAGTGCSSSSSAEAAASCGKALASTRDGVRHSIASKAPQRSQTIDHAGLALAQRVQSQAGSGGASLAC